MGEYRIDDGVPLPAARVGRKRGVQYPWGGLKPGQSFFVPLPAREKYAREGVTITVLEGRLIASWNYYKRTRNLPEVTFRCEEAREAVPGEIGGAPVGKLVRGVRVWRVR